MKKALNHLVSIIVLSYNTKEVLKKCLRAIPKKENYQIIVVDNNSTDGSREYLKKLKIKNLDLVFNKDNLGFAVGNNAAAKIADGRYILFLNSDTILEKNTIDKTIEYLENHPDVGAITCRLNLVSGKLDKDTRRSFPTPWVAISHFAKLDRLFPKSKLFAKYWYTYIPEGQIHEIDVAQGAYFLVKKKVLDQVNWFTPDYFLDGEDIDLCWKIKEQGYKIIYYPKVKALHLKGASKGKRREIKVPFEKRRRFIKEGVRSMEIFYQTRLADKYPKIFTSIIILAIKILSVIRITKLRLDCLLKK